MVDTGSNEGRRRRRLLPRRLKVPRALVAVLLVAGVAAGAAGLAVAMSGPSGEIPLRSPVARETLPPVFTPGPGATPAPPGATPTPAPVPDPSPTGPALPTPTTVPGTVARRIVVERLGIDIPIVKGDGIDAPLGKAAHYPTTAWPDGGTNIYLYAHARDDNFIALWDARVDDRIELKLVDGTSRFYRVTRILPKVKWNALEYLEPTPTEQLTLQTCTSYQNTAPRFLVIAVPEGAPAATPVASPSPATP